MNKLWRWCGVINILMLLGCSAPMPMEQPDRDSIDQKREREIRDMERSSHGL
jgi:hypothetical protein